MSLADGIRKLGFRRWYERELLQSHAHLVLTFLCTLGLFGAFEVLSGAPKWSDQVVSLFTVAASVIIGVWALRRYLYLLMHAETLANQAECPRCRTYGRLALLSADETARDAVDVQCKHCEHRWHIGT